MLNYLDILPEKCIEIIMEYLSYSDFKSCSEVCERFRVISQNLLRLRKFKFQNVLKQKFRGKWLQLEENKQAGPRFDTTLVYYNNFLYLFGGANEKLTTFNDFWKYDLEKNEWSRIISRTSAPNPRAASTGFIYKDELYLIGGYQFAYRCLSGSPVVEWDIPVYKYSFSSNLWTKLLIIKSSKLQKEITANFADLLFVNSQMLTDYPIGQSYCLLNNKLILFGGLHNSLDSLIPRTPTNNLYIFDLDRDYLSLVEDATGNPPSKRFGHNAISLDTHRMVICGGYRRISEMTSPDLFDIYLFDLSNFSWTMICTSPNLSAHKNLNIRESLFNNNIGVFGILVSLSHALSKPVNDNESELNKRKIQVFSNLVLDNLDYTEDNTDNRTVLDVYNSSWLLNSYYYNDAPSLRTGFSMCHDDIGAIYMYGGVYTDQLRASLHIVTNQTLIRKPNKKCFQDLYKFTYKGSAAL